MSKRISKRQRVYLIAVVEVMREKQQHAKELSSALERLSAMPHELAMFHYGGK